MPEKVPGHTWMWAMAMCSVVVDACSGCAEAVQVTTTSSVERAEVLHSTFATCGLPEAFVSGNGPQFIWEAFQT